MARRRWTTLPGGPSTTPRAHLFLFHGTHEHCGRYAEFADRCNQRGILVFSFDFHGHGLREGIRGDFGKLDDAISEAIELVNSERAAAPATPDVPLIIMGHSLGSMVAFLVAHELATTAELPTPSLCVLSGFAMDSVSPPFGVKALVPVLRAMPSAIHKIVTVLAALQPHGPACPLPHASELTHDAQQAALALNDPLHFHGWIQNRTGLALMDARARCMALLPVWGRDFPFLMVHGGADELCPRSACESVLASSPQRDKNLKVFPGLFHEILFESPEARKQVHEYILDWMEPRIAAGASSSATSTAGAAGSGVVLRSRL